MVKYLISLSKKNQHIDNGISDLKMYLLYIWSVLICFNINMETLETEYFYK